MITDDNEEIEIDGIQYRVSDLRQLIRSIKKGCPIECLPLSALLDIERNRQREVDEHLAGIKQEQYRVMKERTSDD